MCPISRVCLSIYVSVCSRSISQEIHIERESEEEEEDFLQPHEEGRKEKERKDATSDSLKEWEERQDVEMSRQERRKMKEKHSENRY